MPTPAPLGQKILGGLIMAFGEHVLEQSPELTALASACRYTSSGPPSKAEHRAMAAVREAVDTINEALGDGMRVARTRLRERMRRKAELRGRRGGKTASPPVSEEKDLPTRLAEFIAQCSPAEREFMEQYLKPEAREFVDLSRKPDGSYGV